MIHEVKIYRPTKSGELKQQKKLNQDQALDHYWKAFDGEVRARARTEPCLRCGKDVVFYSLSGGKWCKECKVIKVRENAKKIRDKKREEKKNALLS